MDARKKAQEGIALIKDAVLELLVQNKGGLRNFEIADALGLRSHQAGGMKDFLTYSTLGLLIADGKVIKQGKQYLAAT
ncbi:MAG: hypothetical protein ACRD1R_03705 [Acidobacteriota bacterium]